MTETTQRARVLDRLLDDLPDLSAQIIAEMRAEISAFHAIPDDVLQLEIRPTVTQNVTLVLGALRDGDHLCADRLASPLRRVMSRVEDRLSFADVLSAYFIGCRVTWQRALRDVAQDDIPALISLVEPLIRQWHGLFVAAARAYVDEEQQLQSEVGQARRDLTAALLAGEPIDELTEPAGTTVSATYVVFVWHVVLAHKPGAGRRTLVRRRRIRGALDEALQATVLTVLDERGGTALVPTSAPEETIATLDNFCAELSAIVGAPVTAAVGVGHRDAVPNAVDEAREVLRVALRLNKPAGLYQLDDVVLEMQLARPGVAHDRLVQRLAPLRERPELMATLRAVLDARNNRRRAARALHVHPNTLAYRLSRIAALTGLDPAEPAGMRVLAAAITAHDLR